MEQIAREIIAQARKSNIRIAVAESVTGGMISAALTAIPGASEVFLAGIVAYDENTKIHSLGVDIKEIHETHGYSEKTVRQMAERVRMRNAADISVATSGCAGPNFVPGFESGRVLFAVAKRGAETKFFDERFAGERNEVREKATEFALRKLLEILKNL